MQATIGLNTQAGAPNRIITLRDDEATRFRSDYANYFDKHETKEGVYRGRELNALEDADHTIRFHDVVSLI